MNYTLDELNKYTIKQLKIILQYEEKLIPKRAKKGELIDLLLQQAMFEELPPASVKIQRIRNSKE